jgi:mediator of RNA polymerase II transcription subunit 10
MFIETARGLGIIVSDFQPSGQTVLNQKLHSMVVGMQEIDKLRAHVSDVMIPIEVFDYIDNGKNPQLYTKECMEKALARNEAVKGKIDSLKKFKTLLIVELSKVFPNEMAKYRQLRGDERPNLDR